MDESLQGLLDQLDQIINRFAILSDQLKALRRTVFEAISIADQSPASSLMLARKILDYVARDVFDRHTHEQAGTRPLENVLQRLTKDQLMPRKVTAYANSVKDLGNVGVHYLDEPVTYEDVVRCLGQLMVILEWYFEHELPRESRTSAHAVPEALDLGPASPQEKAAPAELDASPESPAATPADPGLSPLSQTPATAAAERVSTEVPIVAPESSGAAEPQPGPAKPSPAATTTATDTPTPTEPARSPPRANPPAPATSPADTPAPGSPVGSRREKNKSGLTMKIVGAIAGTLFGTALISIPAGLGSGLASTYAYIVYGVSIEGSKAFIRESNAEPKTDHSLGTDSIRPSSSETVSAFVIKLIIKLIQSITEYPQIYSIVIWALRIVTILYLGVMLVGSFHDKDKTVAVFLTYLVFIFVVGIFFSRDYPFYWGALTGAVICAIVGVIACVINVRGVIMEAR